MKFACFHLISDIPLEVETALLLEKQSNRLENASIELTSFLPQVNNNNVDVINSTNSTPIMSPQGTPLKSSNLGSGALTSPLSNPVNFSTPNKASITDIDATPTTPHQFYSPLEGSAHIIPPIVTKPVPPMEKVKKTHHAELPYWMNTMSKSEIDKFLINAEINQKYPALNINATSLVIVFFIPILCSSMRLSPYLYIPLGNIPI